jgi:apolipoprotein N-acyltransferase
MVGLLLVQFAVGIYVNVFVRIPPPPAAGGMMGAMGAMMSVMSPMVMLHAMLGVLLVAAGVVTVATAAALGRRRKALTWSVAGLVFLLIAGYFGLRFLFFGQHNADSFLMAMAWLGSLSAFLSVWLDAIRADAPAAIGR